jgi:hypothetical protein
VVADVAEESRRLADALDGTPPGVPSHVVALQAIAGSARGGRRVRALRSTLSFVVVLAALLLTVALVRRPVAAAPAETRVVELQCLGPDQAMELARGALPAQVSVSFHPGVHLPILTLRGQHRDLEMAQEVITRLDARWSTERRAYCADASHAHVPATAPPPASR